MPDPIVLRDRESLRAWRKARRDAGQTVALVPTMGALHEGHLSLIDVARREADIVIASIYVNPTQFDRADDLAAYPRAPDGDLAMLARAGCDALFEPPTLYGPHHATWVEVPALSATLCGAHRPGHFRGVATVVTKLLALVAPDVAVFGEKDFQQIQIIRRLVADLDLPTRIVGSPTIREADGLAMSSRNRRLGSDARARAASIHAGLVSARRAFAAGERSPMGLVGLVRAAIEAAEGTVEYAELVEPETLTPLSDAAGPTGVIAVAAWFGGVRLIDNMRLGQG
jgi:pantoate--beta-alanine ligase